MLMSCSGAYIVRYSDFLCQRQQQLIYCIGAMADPSGNQESSASSSNGMHSMMIMILLPLDSFNYEHLLNTLFLINKFIPKIIINL